MYVKQWLDTQFLKANKSPSVIYVAFGSWTCLQSKQIIQIASALTRYPFIWSLKTKFQLHIPSSWINKEQHLLLDWAPQRFILSHPAVRLFISHGGWNSLLESMLMGKPILVWPLFGDQIINGHRVEHELNIGRCMTDTELTNSPRVVSSDEIVRYLQDIFDKETKYAQNARLIQQIILRARDNSSRSYFEEVIKVVDKQDVTYMEKHNEL